MKVAVGAVIALAVTGGIGGAASATPGSTGDLATTRTTPPGTVIGTLEGRAKAKNDGIELKIDGDTQVATFELNYPAGGFSGWHKHPGIVIAVVRTGAVWRQVGCTATKFSAGQSFTEVAPHYVWNAVTDPAAKGATAQLEITQLYPATVTDPAALRVDQPAPRCPYGVHYVDNSR